MASTYSYIFFLTVNRFFTIYICYGYNNFTSRFDVNFLSPFVPNSIKVNIAVSYFTQKTLHYLLFRCTNYISAQRRRRNGTECREGDERVWAWARLTNDEAKRGTELLSSRASAGRVVAQTASSVIGIWGNGEGRESVGTTIQYNSKLLCPI